MCTILLCVDEFWCVTLVLCLKYKFCDIFISVSTSTLSMGVNFPAHLVVIKSTSQYIAGCYKDYSDTQMLQMIGRAGRPQVIILLFKLLIKIIYIRRIKGVIGIKLY